MVTNCKALQDKIDKLLPKTNKESEEYKQFVMMKVYALNLEAELLLETKVASTRVLDILHDAIALSEEFGLTPIGIYGYLFALAQRVAYFYLIDDGDNAAKHFPQIHEVYEHYCSMNPKTSVWDGKKLFGIPDHLYTDELFKKYQDSHNMEQFFLEYVVNIASKFDTADSSGLKSMKI